MLLRLVGVTDLLLIFSWPISIEEKEPYSCDFMKKAFIGLHLGNSRPTSFTLCMMLEITELCI